MNRAERERRMQLRVGIFVVVALAAFLGVVYLLGARARLFESRFTIHADFTEVGGLAQGATVRLAGVQIGRVTGVHLPAEPGGRVRVDMSIATQYGDRIRKNSIARIDTQGLLGDRIIEITVGTREAAPVKANDVIVARDPTDIGQVMTQGAQTVKNVAALAESLRGTAESITKSRIVDDAAATVATVRRATDEIARDASAVLREARTVTEQAGRVVDQVEKGRGWAHVLLYDEPVALRSLNELVVSMQAALQRVERGEGALGVLVSGDSTAAARHVVEAMDRLAGMTERVEGGDSLLSGLLLDPKYKGVLDDLTAVTHNLRDVSERLAGGRGMLGGLLRDESEDGGIRQASRDLQAALANLKDITEKINEGEGTLGALIGDPTIYERLVRILDSTQRSFLLRALIRGLGKGGKGGDGPSAKPNERPRERAE